MRRIVPALGLQEGESSLSKGWRDAVTVGVNNLERTLSAEFVTGLSTVHAAYPSTLMDFTIPSGLLAAPGDAVEIKAWGAFDDSGSTNKFLRMLIGGVIKLSFNHADYDNARWTFDGAIYYANSTTVSGYGQLFTQIAGVEVRMDNIDYSLDHTVGRTIAFAGNGTDGDVLQTGLVATWRGRTL